jgi:predicted RNase H-like nuclease
MKFLGIDLGWSSGASGLSCLVWQDGKLMLTDLQRILDLADLFTWIDAQLPPDAPGMVAVDAPTLIPNATGMRLCDRLAHKYFGKYHAGCYPANLGLPFAQRTVGFGLSLEARGFHHAPTIQPQQLGRFQIESFPHPAIVHLFHLDRILKYKKGTVAERRLELARLRAYICDRLPLLDPPLDVCRSAIGIPEIPIKGTELKAVEDQLDSIICAYIAAHWWYWGLERNQVLGDLAEGYIVVPTPSPASSPTLSLG